MTTSLPIAVVTGGARGIGKQLATDLLARGYHVVIGDLDLAVTQETARELGESVTAAQLDVTDPVSAAQLIEHVETELGPIDLWVNNAGIMPTESFSTQDARVAQRIIAINYASVVSLTGLVLQRMLPRNRGTIVNMASATGIKPLAGVAVYSGTKAAVIAFSDALRRELRHTGLTITVVNPNLVTTAMGAGITPPALTGSVTAMDVSRAVMRALDTKRFWVVVPRRLGPLLRFSKALPVRVQDWLDDRAGSDSIGLGGDPDARRDYAKGVLGG